MTESFDWLTLDDDETILWSGQPARESLYGAYVVGLLTLPLLGFGVLVILSAYLRQKHTDYVITSKGVYKKTGILSRSVAEVEYDKVQNTSFSVGPVGRYFDYGSVDISTAGGSGVEMQLRAVADPQAVQKRLSRRVKQAQGDRSDEEETDTDDVLDEILGELRAIRVSLEARKTPETDR